MTRWMGLAGRAAVRTSALSLIAVGSALFADPPIGSRLGERLERKKVADERQAAQAAHELAGCVVDKRESVAHELLASRDLENLKKLGSRISGDVECFGTLPRNHLVEGIRVAYPHDIMRGHLAEQLIKRNRIAASQLQPLPLQRVYSRSWFPFTGRHTSLDEMAACVADTNPAAIMALLGTEPFSNEENAAFGRLVPAMGPCLVAGTKLSGKREPLRAALAEAIYQRLLNPAESMVSAK